MTLTSFGYSITLQHTDLLDVYEARVLAGAEVGVHDVDAGAREADGNTIHLFLSAGIDKEGQARSGKFTM